MKKLIIIFIAIFMLVGCSNANFMEEQEKVTEDDLIGLWDEVMQLQNGDFYISGTIFYESNKCSFYSYVISGGADKTLLDSMCTYNIDGNDIYIDGTLSYTYNETDNTLVDINGGIKNKANDNPCSTQWSHCD